MAKYLSDSGLSYFWGKLTSLFMKKADYDTNADGKVNSADDSDKLGGVAASGYAKEISGQTELSFDDISGADYFPLHDTSAAVQKKYSWNSFLGKLSATYMQIYSGVTTDTVVSDDDYIPYYDSSVPIQKKTLWSNIKSVLKTYFDTLYAVTSHNHDSTYAPKITVTTDTSSTTISITTAADKTVYRFTQNITALTITNNPSTAPWAYRVEFTAGGTFTPSFPAGISWNGGTAPTMTSGKKYSLIITSHISSYAES